MLPPPKAAKLVQTHSIATDRGLRTVLACKRIGCQHVLAPALLWDLRLGIGAGIDLEKLDTNGYFSRQDQAPLNPVGLFQH